MVGVGRRRGNLLTVFHDDTCPATAVCAWPRCALDRVADMTADAEHTLAMLDAGTFDRHLTAAARQRPSAPGRAARPRPRRRCGRGRRHPPRGLRCDGVVPGLRQAPCARMALGQCRARRAARTAGSCRPTITTYRARSGSCWRTLMLGRGARRLPMRPRSPSHLGKGDAPPVAARAPSAGRAGKPPAPIPFVSTSMCEFSRLMNLQGVQQLSLTATGGASMPVKTLRTRSTRTPARAPGPRRSGTGPGSCRGPRRGRARCTGPLR